MARKRKSAAEAANVCPRDLNEIPYIAWMNKQLSAGRKPSGPQPVGTPSRGDTSYQAPRDVPTRGRRDADWVASSRSPEVNTYGVEDDDADYNEEADGTDDEADSREEDDKGMSDSDATADADDTETDDEDAPEESQPATPPVRRGPAKAAPGVKNAAKGGEPPRRAPKIRDPMPVKRSVWSPLTILVAARWFTKDELEPLLGKQGSQYWARLVRHLEAENPGWVRGVNAMQKQWRNLVSMFKQLQKADKASGNGVVCARVLHRRYHGRGQAGLRHHQGLPRGCDGKARGARLRLDAARRRDCPRPQPGYDPTATNRQRSSRGSATQPAPTAAEGDGGGWFRRGDAGGVGASPDEAKEVWVRGDAE
ncbi:unnamed protein product [Closterium sp. NIES-65]|nr:unnamed protein product [Closterium sp. NIES-65]